MRRISLALVAGLCLCHPHRAASFPKSDGNAAAKALSVPPVADAAPARAGSVASASAPADPIPLPAALPAEAPEAGTLASDSAEDVDSIVAEADSAARAVLAANAGGEETVAPAALWLETYGEGVFSRHEDHNLAGFADWKVGKRLPGPLQADVYAKVRLYRDQRDFFWNNRADGGLGVRVSLLRKVSLIAFAEATWGHYLSLASGAVPIDRLQARIESNRAAIDEVQKNFQAMYQQIFTANVLTDPDSDRAVLNRLETLGDKQTKALASLNGKLDSLETAKDSLRQVMDSIALVPAGSVVEYKAGLVFWQGWGGPEDSPPASWFAFPLRFWGDVYADAIASTLQRHVLSRQASGDYADSVAHIRNLILYANPAVGWLVMDSKAGSLVAYATAYAWYDTHRDWWNNLAMGGPGLRYQPFRQIDLSVKAEYLWGRYYGREREEDPNPYAPSFADTRVTASFWHGLGI